MKKSVAAVCAIFMCAALFISCGGKKNEKLVYWSMWNEAEPQGRVIAEAAQEFEKETGIRSAASTVGNRRYIQSSHLLSELNKSSTAFRVWFRL